MLGYRYINESGFNALVLLCCNLFYYCLRRSLESLFCLDNSIFESGLVNALVMLCSNLEMDLKCKPNIAQVGNILTGDNYLWRKFLISSDPQCKHGNARFTTVPFKLLNDHRGMRNLCVYLSNSVWIAAKLDVHYRTVWTHSWNHMHTSKMSNILSQIQSGFSKNSNVNFWFTVISRK